MAKPRKIKPETQGKKAAREKAKAAEKDAAKAAALQAAAKAKKFKAKAEAFKKNKELGAYLIVFCLHYHACSVKEISSVLESYDMDAKKQGIERCIEQNKLFTYKQTLPDDISERSVFTLDETPDLTVEKIHAKKVKIKMTHPLLPAIYSAALVIVTCPEDPQILIEASKQKIVFEVFCPPESYDMETLVQHFTRCMQRAIGFKFPASALPH
ncbi:hypothetical protein MMC29_001724 [Sticta canariensis]|nr:hypothetical protein [Sticta canariensis]